jgi:hypothetical protein
MVADDINEPIMLPASELSLIVMFSLLTTRYHRCMVESKAIVSQQDVECRFTNMKRF